ncbi:MAG: ATP-dependent nuclease, partial [Pseudomonadales bacterium]
MAYQSEIRDSQINELLDKVQSKKYGKYLLKVHIDKARSFSRKTVTFDFPVTAFIGPNGGGKTTLLGAAACAYQSVKPSRFFAKSGRFDSSMKNWKFEYEVIDRSVRPTDTVRRTATFTNLKWSRDGLARDVSVFGVSRTVPATERPEMLRFAGGKFDVAEEFITTLSPTAMEAVAKILDKDFSKFKQVALDEKGAVTLIAGQTTSGDAYSEFHFGAGESSIIRMIAVLEDVPEGSLVMIEEIENGLHPLATMRLVEYLIDLAERRKIQSIFTTHSNDALTPLPSKAIWAAVNGNLYQGKLDVAALRAISGQVDSRLVIFVEDNFAKSWTEEIIRSASNIAMDAIEVHAMKGDGIATRIHIDHNINPTTKQPSICIIDGDSQQSTDIGKRIFRLPGSNPEAYIFNRVVASLDATSGELAVALLRPYEKEAEVRAVIESVGNTNRDPHLLFAQVGKRLGLIPEARVREAFLSVWVRHYHDEATSF